MARGFASRSGKPDPSNVYRMVRMAVLLVPATLLMLAAVRVSGRSNLLLFLGTAFQLLCCALSFLSSQGRRLQIGPSIITLYIIALGWLWLGHDGLDDWFFHLAQAILLVVPLAVFAVQSLTDSGATVIRRAQLLARRLASRKDWPADLAACRTLPEVKALREALHVDATPALALLRHPRPQVRVAALAALEFRQNWNPGHAELILEVARGCEEPAVRAGAVMALGNLDDRILVERVAEFLHDPAVEVRRAAAEALLWDSERRWSWIAPAVRRSLADPAFKDDGPLHHEGHDLTAPALADLTAWAAEKGILSFRAAMTLGAHYARLLPEQPDDRLAEQLRHQMADPHTPPPLRLEMLRALEQNRELDRDLLERLLDPSNPAPMRLTAVEALLAMEDHPVAVAALHDLARMPNREIALATADVVQRRLGVDLGLALGEALPPVHSRQAAEVARRVMAWATRHDTPEAPGERAARPPSRVPEAAPAHRVAP